MTTPTPSLFTFYIPISPPLSFPTQTYLVTPTYTSGPTTAYYIGCPKSVSDPNDCDLGHGLAYTLISGGSSLAATISEPAAYTITYDCVHDAGADEQPSMACAYSHTDGEVSTPVTGTTTMVGTEIVWSVATSAGVEEFLEEGEASRTGGVPQLTATAEAEAGAEKVRRHEEESSTAIVIQTVPVDEYDTDTVTATTTASKGTAKPPPPGDKEKPTESKTGAEPPEETGAAGRLEGGKAVWGAAVAAVLGALGVAFM